MTLEQAESNFGITHPITFLFRITHYLDIYYIKYIQIIHLLKMIQISNEMKLLHNRAYASLSLTTGIE